jgi:GAF domain-containing protein
MYPIPINEEERLSHLRALQMLDTPPSPNFDRICAIAREHFRAPVAAVSFLDADRVWFKASCGMGAREVPRGQAACCHAVLQDDVLVVPDLLADTRFRSMPFVAGPPFLRFYAAAPIIYSPEIRLGSVCVFDHAPRQIGEGPRSVLRHLAEIAVTELRLIQTSRAYFRREFSGKDAGQAGPRVL